MIKKTVGDNKAKKLEVASDELDELMGRNDEAEFDDDFPESPRLVSEEPNAESFRRAATRKSSMRSAEQRDKTWMPPSHLPDAPELPGWRHRWCRYISGSNSDDVNMSTRMREGYEPVPRKEEAYAEIVKTLGYGFRADHSDLIIAGGHVLCRIPDEVAEGRTEYYQQQALRQLKSTKEKATNLGDGETRIKMTVDEFKTKVSKNLYD